MPVSITGPAVTGVSSRPSCTRTIVGPRSKHAAGVKQRQLGVCKAATPDTFQRTANVSLDFRDAFLATFRFLQGTVKGYGNTFLQGAWAPVKKEIHSNSLKVVEGQVPMELDGWYMRTGPNPQHEPHGGYNWFADGDAMIHAVVFQDGEAKSYCNHWVKNFKFKTEREAGQNLFLRLGEQKGVLGLVLTVMQRAAWKFDLFPKPPPLQGGNLGMAGIVVHDNRVLALHEGNLPYQMKLNPDGSVESVSPYTFNGQMKHAFTAHPKLDWFTGEMISFGNSLESAPHVIFNIVRPDGEVTEDIPIDVNGPLWMHDFAITNNYAVFMEHNVILDLKAMVREHKVPFVTDNSQPGRVGLLNRKNVHEPVRWFEVDPYVNLHVANAWEESTPEGEMVHTVICRVKEMDLSMASEPVPKEGDPAILTRYSVNTTTGEVTTTALVDYGIELPVVAPQVVGRPASRFCWAVVQSGMKFSGIVKADMRAAAGEGVVARIDFPEDCFGGEVIFVARDSAALARGEASDDDGFVIGYMTNEKTLTSYCVVYDAKTMSSDPVVKIQLPQRVPYGFHGAYFERWQLPQL